MPATRRSLRAVQNVKKEPTKENVPKVDLKRAKVVVRKWKKSASDSEVQSLQTDDSPDSNLSSDSDLSSDDENIREKLEKKRISIQQHKLEVIEKLNLHQAALDLKASCAPKPAKRRILSKKPLVATRKSLRLQKVKADDKTVQDVQSAAPKFQQGKPTTEYEMEPIGFEKDETFATEEQIKAKRDCDQFLSSVKTLGHRDTDPVGSEEKHSMLPMFIERMKKLVTKGLKCNKVVYQRINSMAFYPGNDKLLLAVGSVSGAVGLWDMERSDASGGAYLADTHNNAVRCLKFCPTRQHALYSCSYDGILRALDLHKCMFEEALLADIDNPGTSFDFKDGDTIICGTYGGDVIIIDTRCPKDCVSFHAHRRTAKCISVHPTHAEYFATCGNDSIVNIYDCRVVSASKARPLITLHDHSKSIDSAFFSPRTGNKLLTTSLDDRIRIFNTSNLEPSSVRLTTSVYHNNYTTRWLSNFQANWHPAREDLIIVGSMARPRQIELMDSELCSVFAITSPDLSSICSLNYFHPHRDILVGGNSSGKVFALGL